VVSEVVHQEGNPFEYQNGHHNYINIMNVLTC